MVLTCFMRFFFFFSLQRQVHLCLNACPHVAHSTRSTSGQASPPCRLPFPECQRMRCFPCSLCQHPPRSFFQPYQPEQLLFECRVVGICLPQCLWAASWQLYYANAASRFYSGNSRTNHGGTILTEHCQKPGTANWWTKTKWVTYPPRTNHDK